jgi:glycosyltransferase involved in cell wall biosynthesis
MRIVIVTTDNREHERTYEETVPRFCAGHYSLLEGFMQTPELEVHVVSCTQKPMSSPEKLAENMWFHSPYVPKIGWLRSGYQGCVRAVRAKAHELQPDIVHGHGTERECAISAALSGRPNLVTIHGNMAAQAAQFRPRIGSYAWLQTHVETFAIRRTMGVLCNSAYTENMVRARARKTWLVPHALRLAFFDPPPDPAPRPCVLLNAGVISPRKRQLELLDVAERLHRQGLKFELRFIGFMPSGHSPYATQFLERIRPMEAAGYARFLGPQPEATLVASFDSAAGVIHFPTEEAFGNVVIEALSRDLKFFGTRLGGIVDIAHSAPGAELFERDDWSGLTGAVATWIRQGNPRPVNAAAFVAVRYHPRAIAACHVAIYRDVLKSRR